MNGLALLNYRFLVVALVSCIFCSQFAVAQQAQPQDTVRLCGPVTDQ